MKKKHWNHTVCGYKKYLLKKKIVLKFAVFIGESHHPKDSQLFTRDHENNSWLGIESSERCIFCTRVLSDFIKTHHVTQNAWTYQISAILEFNVNTLRAEWLQFDTDEAVTLLSIRFGLGSCRVEYLYVRDAANSCPKYTSYSWR